MINELCKEAHSIAKEKGWHNTERNIPELLCLMHSEISEALECYRDDNFPNDLWFVDGKPEGIPIELADVLIRIFDFCGLHKIDLESAIRLKMNYNKTRPHRHGGKRA